MFRTRLPALLLALACSFSVFTALPARAENPLERLHKKLFGDEDRDRRDTRTDAERKKDKERERERDKEREKARKREEERRRNDDHRNHDHSSDERRYDDRRYDERREPVVVERRVYVEPAARPYYEPEPRNRYAARSLEAEVQLALRREGYYRGPIDGEIGPGTRSAIRDYQYDQQLPATGRIDNYLVRSLGL